MERTPIQARRSANLALRIDRLRTVSGMTAQQMISNAMLAHTAAGPIDRAGNRRQPI